MEDPVFRNRKRVRVKYSDLTPRWSVEVFGVQLGWVSQCTIEGETTRNVFVY